MLISRKELLQHNIDKDLKTLTKDLIQLGHEVDSVTTFENDKLVIGKILELEKHPDAEKLNVAKVDVGAEILQIVCGAPNIKNNAYVIVALPGCKLEDFEIKKVKLRGVESNGMICSLAEVGLSDNVINQEDKDGIYIFDEEKEVGINAFKEIGLLDDIIELGLTANRGDCQSYVGVIRDLNALYNIENEIKVSEVKGKIENPFEVINSDDNTKQLTSLYIKNITNLNTPLWLKIWLAKNEIKSQNIISDLTNYVMLQLGLPIHGYDATKLENKLEVTRITEKEEYVALDEKTYDLKFGDLVIKDANKVVSLASVIGSNETKVTDNTNEVLLEIGVFDPVGVRKTATSIGKKTSASSRGEKNVDHKQIENAYNLFLEILAQTNSSIEYSQINQTTFKEEKSKYITLKYIDVEKVLGIKVNNTKEILTNLKFEIVNETNDEISVSVPTWRFDIENDHDLIEEVIRMVGMDEISINEVLSSFQLKDKIITTPKVKIERDLENFMLNLGFDQMITYSLVSEEMLNEFNNNVLKPVQLMMPLSNNHRYYRQSLIPSLLKVVKHNFDRGQEGLQIFEVGNTYYKSEEDEIKEQYYLSGVCSGVKQKHLLESTKYDFYDLKFVIEEVLKNYDIDFEIIKSNQTFAEFNPFVSADILVEGKIIGKIGEVIPNYIKKCKHKIFAFEINLEMIQTLLNPVIKYEQINPNPSINRDLTITADINLEYKEVLKVFTEIKYLEIINLKDIYSGDKIEKNKKAITFNLLFNEKNKTLTSEEVEEEIQKIFTNCENIGCEIKQT